MVRVVVVLAISNFTSIRVSVTRLAFVIARSPDTTNFNSFRFAYRHRFTSQLNTIMLATYIPARVNVLVLPLHFCIFIYFFCSMSHTKPVKNYIMCNL